MYIHMRVRNKCICINVHVHSLYTCTVHVSDMG